MKNFRASRPGQMFHITALLVAYNPAIADTIVANNGESKQLDATLIYTNVIVNNGGSLTGDSSAITGASYELVKINAGGTASLTNAKIFNNITTATGTNGRAVTASGAGANVTLSGATIDLTAFSTNPGADYNHAFTAGVGAENGGHVEIVGGSINARGSKRTVGIQANNGGAITARGSLTIDTYNHFAHAVNAYSNPLGPSSTTKIDLQDVNISTHGASYAVGIQSANKGSAVTGVDTNISTVGVNSFGAEVFNGATLSLTRGNITTTGANAAGVRTYGGSLGSGVSTLTGTQISTSGTGAAGMIAGDIGEPTSGMINLDTVGVHTTGDHASGVQADYGSVITLKDSTVNTGGSVAHGVHAQGAGVITLDHTTVATRGAGAIGLVAGDVDAGLSPTAGHITFDNGRVTTDGVDAPAARAAYGGSLTVTNVTLVARQSAGLVVNDTARVTLTGTTVQAGGASIVSNLVTTGVVQDLQMAGSTLTQNNGTLLQVNRTGAGYDGIVNLTLQPGTVASGNVVDLDGLSAGGSETRSQGGKTNFTVQAGAQWTGLVKGINDTDTGNNASFTDHGGAPIAGNVSGGTSSLITFTNGADIRGSVQVGAGSTATFHGPTTIRQDVTGQGATFAFNGPTVLNQNVIGQGTNMTFGGSATIGQSVMAAQGSNFVFSQTAPTAIQGNVVLQEGSTIKGGHINAPITIAGNATVNNGSTLGGNLLVGGALGGTGGSLSPGNSVGTQTYGSSGNFTGAYVAEVNAAGLSDLIVIQNGNINLAGIDLTVKQENGNGGYVLNHDYTLLKTEGGNVVNTFKSETLDPASFANTLVKLDPAKYGPKDVKVSLSVDAGKAAAKRSGLSANQNATLDGVISVAGGNQAADAALLSTDTKAALNQLSGEVHAGTQSVLLSSSNLLVATLSNRLRGNLGAGKLAGAPLAQSSGAVPASALPGSAAYPLWAQVTGAWQTLDGNDNTAKIRSATGGLVLGGDTLVAHGWRVGGALGITNSVVKVDDRASRSTVNSYTAALYSGNSWKAGAGRVNFLAGAAYTRHSIDSRRTVNLSGNQTLKADYDGYTTQLFTELGYAFPVGPASVIEPYLGAAWLSQHSNAFSESGGAAALRGDSRTDDIKTVTLGVRGKTVFNVGPRDVSLFAGIGWRHTAGDAGPTRRMAFIQGNSVAFNVAGAPIARNAAVLNLGVESALGKMAALGISYNGQIGQGNTDNTGSLYLKMRF